ncbi:uncharacterized protein [Littorina saxatilis]|uniref:uncharacterized protein n=1 Tax=Littorina saxatilis TaxID=31220 RepID=UPI0038B678D5
MPPANDISDIMSRSDDDIRPRETAVTNMGQRLNEVGADVQALKIQSSHQDQDIKDARSSTFVHWCSSRCTDASQLVYSGVVGGSFYSETGAATNYHRAGTFTTAASSWLAIPITLLGPSSYVWIRTLKVGQGVVTIITVTRCGSLPCGPSVNDKVVTCAVCSK